MKPLEGIRVLDLTRLLPGPYATLLLADLGADVVRVEDPNDADFVRWVPPSWPSKDGGEGASALFVALNRGKRSVMLDLKKAEGTAAFLRLAAKADVVVEGFRPGVMDRLGIGWSVLSKANPRLSFCAISGYGQTGPLAQRAGHDLNYLALAGALGIGGPAEGPPAHPGVQVADLSASLTAVAAVLGAVLARERADAREKGSGRGSFLDISMYDSAAGMMIFHLPGLLAGGKMERGKVQLTGAHPNYRVYRTKDGRWLSVGSLEPKFWKRFVTAAGRPELEGDAFAAMADETARVALSKTMTELVASKTLAEWEAILGPADACAEPVLEGEEVTRLPHAAARGIAIEGEDPTLGKVRVPASPIRPWSQEARYRPAPAPGEHSVEVLREAGFGAAEIDALRAAKVLG